MQHITKTEKETFALGKNLGKSLKGGELIALIGNLGAGKTVFTQGVAKGLGVTKQVNSPTFVIMKIYNTNKKNKAIKNLCHVDAYRITTMNELNSLGLDEYINSNESVVVIEWADKLKRLPKKTQFVKFKINKEVRLITL